MMTLIDHANLVERFIYIGVACGAQHTAEVAATQPWHFTVSQHQVFQLHNPGISRGQCREHWSYANRGVDGAPMDMERRSADRALQCDAESSVALGHKPPRDKHTESICDGVLHGDLVRGGSLQRQAIGVIVRTYRAVICELDDRHHDPSIFERNLSRIDKLVLN